MDDLYFIPFQYWHLARQQISLIPGTQTETQYSNRNRDTRDTPYVEILFIGFFAHSVEVA